ncbi:MAG: lamin tail domain-containing protein, partial [Bacteroidia bacterium]|nr:lamin tail domain-containing protein [Bacteroidia bacterium]
MYWLRTVAWAAWLGPVVADAQAVKIFRFVPGNYLADDLHKVELVADRPVDISGYLLVTRDYSVRIPNGTKIAPGKSFVAAKKNGDLKLEKCADFLIRPYSRAVEGNYVALFNRGGQMVDGFYHAQIPNVPFLPDSGVCILSNYKTVAFKLPPEQLPIWGYFPLGDDPAVGYERTREGWKPIAANPLRPQAVFDDFSGRYNDGAVMLRWSARGEDLPVRIERSYDQKNFRLVATLEGAVGEGRYFDSEPPENTTVFYRLAAGNAVSRVLEVTTSLPEREFELEIFPKRAAKAQDLSVRLYTGFSQRVRVKIYDRSRALISVLLD